MHFVVKRHNPKTKKNGKKHYLFKKLQKRKLKKNLS